VIISAYFERGRLTKLNTPLSFMLAVPHLAFAIGFGFLIMPSGLLARLIGLTAGWVLPPLWATTHDSYAIALTIALVAKETAFLLFVLVNVLARDDIAQRFISQRHIAFGLGHSNFSIWKKLFIPQLVAHLIWPVVIVFIYAATVVDMSLVLGPTQPPVFADIIWADINSADPAQNARGAAGAVFISLLAAACLALVFIFSKAIMPMFKRWMTRGPSRTGSLLVRDIHIGQTKWVAMNGLYIAIIVALVLLSFASLWPFPSLLPETWNSDAWKTVVQHAAPLITSLVLAIATSVSALIMLLLWLENSPRRFDRGILVLSVLVLGLPALLIGLGQYQLFLRLQLTGTMLGLLLAHLTPVVAYMFIMLNGPYRSYETKWRDAATGLMATPLHFLLQVKWPMLKSPLLSSLAVGFAVSFAQFVPAQLVAAGRYSTLPMEAVTLSSGSNRALTAAFALLLMLPPLLVFLTSGLLSKSRWSNE
jgi:putative thiamine transport system permease protein